MEENKNKFKVIGFTISILIYLGLLLFYLYRRNKIINIYNLLQDKTYIINLLIIIFFTIYILKLNGVGLFHNDKCVLKKMKEAVKKAIFGFIIAILAYLDITISAYWIIFIFTFYAEGFI